MRKIALIVYVGLATMGCYYGWLWIRTFGTETAVTTFISEAVSPDGRWRAWVDQYEVRGDFPFLTDSIATVHLALIGNPSDIGDMLGVDVTGNPKLIPSVKWLSSTMIEVTVPNLSYTDVLNNRYKIVGMNVRFSPDDPAARRAWFDENAEMDRRLSR